MSKASNSNSALLDAAEKAARARGHDGFSSADLARVEGKRVSARALHDVPRFDMALQGLLARLR